MDVIRFTRGVPPAEAFPIQQIIECSKIALEHHSKTVLNYHPAQGFEPLRVYLAEQAGANPDEIIVSNGSLQLQHFLAHLLVSQPGDRVLIESPSYDRAIVAFKQAGAEVIGVPLHLDGLDVDRLAELVKEKTPRFLYLIPDFQNPTGVTTSLAKRQRIAELARQYRFWILEDSPYHLLRYRGEDVPTLRELASDCTLSLSSLSKLLSPGMRVGWLIGPADLVRKLAKIAEDTYVTPNMLSQGIAYEYLCSELLEPNITKLKELYLPRLDAMLAALEEHLPEARFARPEGGFFVGVTLTSGATMPALLIQAETAGIVLSDGRGFYPNDGGERFVRLPFCSLTTSEINEGIARLSWVLKNNSRGADT